MCVVALRSQNVLAESGFLKSSARKCLLESDYGPLIEYQSGKLAIKKIGEFEKAMKKYIFSRCIRLPKPIRMCHCNETTHLRGIFKHQLYATSFVPKLYEFWNQVRDPQNEYLWPIECGWYSMRLSGKDENKRAFLRGHLACYQPIVILMRRMVAVKISIMTRWSEHTALHCLLNRTGKRADDRKKRWIVFWRGALRPIIWER